MVDPLHGLKDIIAIGVVYLANQGVPAVVGSQADLQRATFAGMVLEYADLDSFDGPPVPRRERKQAQMFGQGNGIENLRERRKAEIGKQQQGLRQGVAPSPERVLLRATGDVTEPPPGGSSGGLMFQDAKAFVQHRLRLL